MESNLGWFVLYVKSRWENKVHDALQEMSVEVFFPKVKIVKRWSDRKKSTLKPLFPSYVFVNLKSSLDFYKALSINGACFYIKFGETYAKVTENEINQIKLLFNSNCIKEFTVGSKLPKIGETKKITQGPLKGLDCEIIEADRHNKIIVRIDYMHQNIVATMSTDSFVGV